MQLDRLRRHTGLPVVVVEEADTGNASSSAELHVAPGYPHLMPPLWRGAAVAGWRGGFGGHAIAALFHHNVEIAVVLRTDEYDRGADGVDVVLERQARLWQARRRRPGDQEMDGRFLRR